MFCNRIVHALLLSTLSGAIASHGHDGHGSHSHASKPTHPPHPYPSHANDPHEAHDKHHLFVRTPISTDGKCGSGVTCVGSQFGDCCSAFGYCGSTADYCGTSGSSSSGSSTNVSPDGTCGKDHNGYKCKGSTFGDCCSQYGYCGSTSNHCGTGCLSDYGTCGSSVSKSSSSSSTSKAGTATMKPSTSSSTKATSAAAATTAASTGSSSAVAVCSSGPNLISNPSFEDGLSPWTTIGGPILQTNGQDNRTYLQTSAGTKFIQLESSAANPNSSVIQTISNRSGGKDRVTLTFDWQFMVSSASRGPPRTECTLLVRFADFITMASFSRPASQGGGGHEEATLDLYTQGDLRFSFFCQENPTNMWAEMLLDNIQLREC